MKLLKDLFLISDYERIVKAKQVGKENPNVKFKASNCYYCRQPTVNKETGTCHNCNLKG